MRQNLQSQTILPLEHTSIYRKALHFIIETTFLGPSDHFALGRLFLFCSMFLPYLLFARKLFLTPKLNKNPVAFKLKKGIKIPLPSVASLRQFLDVEIVCSLYFVVLNLNRFYHTSLSVCSTLYFVWGFALDLWTFS